jgi:hypothetical protein
MNLAAGTNAPTHMERYMKELGNTAASPLVAGVNTVATPARCVAMGSGFVQDTVAASFGDAPPVPPEAEALVSPPLVVPKLTRQYASRDECLGLTVLMRQPSGGQRSAPVKPARSKR